jgi:hypothetical protein
MLFLPSWQHQNTPEPVAEQPVFHKVAANLYRPESSGAYYALLKRGGKQFRRSLKTKDHKLADRRLSRLRSKIGCLQISPEARLRFTQAAHLWLETNKHALSSSTVKRKGTQVKGLLPISRRCPCVMLCRRIVTVGSSSAAPRRAKKHSFTQWTL